MGATWLQTSHILGPSVVVTLQKGGYLPVRKTPVTQTIAGNRGLRRRARVHGASSDRYSHGPAVWIDIKS